MTLEAEVQALRREIRELKKAILEIKPKVQPPQWVRLKVLQREFPTVTYEQIKYARRQNEGVARQRTSGQYEYNLNFFSTEFRKIA